MTLHQRSGSILLLCLSLLAFGLCGGHARAAMPLVLEDSDCTPPDLDGDSSLNWERDEVLELASKTEAKGQADFHLHYLPPGDGECLLQTLQLGDTLAAVNFNPVTKGKSIVRYRIELAHPGSGRREMLVLRGQAIPYLIGGYLYYVAEENKGTISWYAMYNEEPSYSQVKELIGQIIDGKAPPLLTVRWPKGTRKAEVVAMDSQRLHETPEP